LLFTIRILTINNIIQKVASLLREAHFETFHFEGPTKRIKFCFDILVKKDNSIFLVKVFPNIDNLNESVMENIKLLSVLLNSKPLLIGIKNRYQNLEDNTIYIREELPFITFKTLENVLKEQKYPHILARRGGGVIFLDGDLMKSLREQKSISRKEISDKLGVTKRTLCSYENETMRPSQKIAIQEESSQKRDLTDFESHLQDIFEDIGVSTIWYKKGQLPFELSISSNNYALNAGEEFYPVLSGLSQETTKVSKLNIHHLSSFAEFFHKNAFFIVNNDFKISDNKIGVPVIKLKDLEKMDTEKDLVEIFEES